MINTVISFLVLIAFYCFIVWAMVEYTKSIERHVEEQLKDVKTKEELYNLTLKMGLTYPAQKATIMRVSARVGRGLRDPGE